MFVTFEQPLKRKLWFLLLFLLTLTGSEAQNPFLERLNAFNPLAIARNFLAPVLHLPASRPLRSGPLVIRHQRISSTRTPITAKPSKSIEIKPTTLAPVKLQKNQVEVAEIASNVSCGKVPIFERLYHRSINDSDVINDDHGDFRILHGLDATPGEWPWLVRITECLEPDNCGTCTGTLLNSRWVITAGHCGFNRSLHLDRFTATFGLYDLVSPDASSFSVPIEKLVVHPDYHELNNDLTLVKLAKSVQFGEFVQPACLIHATRNVLGYTEGKRCYNVGYGLTDGMAEPLKLQKVQISAKSPDQCNSDQLGTVQLKRGTVCIGPARGKIGGSCKGDSGGPDLCFDPRMARWVIFGTVSYGPADCDRDEGDKWLTVSVDLSNYRSWILSTISA